MPRFEQIFHYLALQRVDAAARHGGFGQVGFESRIGRRLRLLATHGHLLTADELPRFAVARLRGALARDFGDEHPFVDIHYAGTLLYEDRALYRIGDLHYGAHHVAYHLRTLDRVRSRFAQHQLGLEREKILLVLANIGVHLVGRMRACERIGIVLGRQQHHAHVHALLQDHVDSAQRGVYARRIAVVYNGYVTREAM